jgi:Fungal specific transcription factor domain
MTKTFNDWTLRLLLQDPALLNATMCMAAAETEIRNGSIPDVTKPLNGSARITDYTYFKLEAIKYLNRTLCSSDNGKLNPASICAIMFLAFAEVCCL